MDKSLKEFLKTSLKKSKDNLGVIDSKLAKSIKEKLGTDVTSESVVQELTRGIRSQLPNLLSDVSEKDLSHMVLGLSHSLSRYKIKFSPDKVDTMIVQAIGKLPFSFPSQGEDLVPCETVHSDFWRFLQVCWMILTKS